MSYTEIGKLVIHEVEINGEKIIGPGFIPVTGLPLTDESIIYFAGSLAVAFGDFVNMFSDCDQIGVEKALKMILNDLIDNRHNNVQQVPQQNT